MSDYISREAAIEKGTRTFFCSFGEAKMNGGIENASKEM